MANNSDPTEVKPDSTRPRYSLGANIIKRSLLDESALGFLVLEAGLISREEGDRSMASYSLANMKFPVTQMEFRDTA